MRRFILILVLAALVIPAHRLAPPARSFSPLAPTANAGPDVSAYVNETVRLDGSASTNAFDDWKADSDTHSIKWDLGFDQWTYEGGLIAPVAYPQAGVYTATLTVCDSAGVCASDTATITVTAITCSSEVTISDSGNAVTNMSNLQTEINNSTGTNTKCINLPAGVVFRGELVLKYRTVTNYLTIRTTAHASLPASPRRVFPADAANMAIFEAPAGFAVPMVETGTTSSNPARYYQFIGIHFRKNDPTFNFSANPFINIGRGDETSTSQYPNHIGFDRCYFDGGSTTSNTLRAVTLRGSDVFFTNSYFHRFKGASLETQAIGILGGFRQAFVNNFMEGAAECWITGGGDPSVYVTAGTAQSTGNGATTIKLAAGASAVDDAYNDMGIYLTGGTGGMQEGRIITDYDGTTKIATIAPAWGGATPDGTTTYKIGDHVPTDIVFRRNHLKKDLGWRNGDPAYYGVDMTVKNIWELKLGLHISAQGNLFENHWQEDQNYAIVVTVRNQDGTAPWSQISYVDFAHNKVHKIARGINILAKDDLHFTPSIHHIIFRHIIFSGVSYYNGIHNIIGQYAATGNAGDRISFVRTTSDGNGDPLSGVGRWLEFDTTTGFTNCRYLGNIAQGYLNHASGTGTTALQSGCSTSSYQFTKNGLYRSQGTNPGGNTTVTTRADVKFTDVANFDLSLAADSPFLTTGLGGGRAGADVAAVNYHTRGAESGNWEEATKTLGGGARLSGGARL